MAVEIEVIGNGRYAGAKSNIGEYSVLEESTPSEASDTSGGTGQVTFNAVEDPTMFGSALLLNDTIRLTDGDRGDTEGKINSLNGNNGSLSVTADSRLGRLVIDTTAVPVHDTFTNVMTYYLSLGGITTGIAIDTSFSAINVVAQGWTGDLWTYIKQLCVVYGAEISLVKGNVVVRPMRERRALEINNVNESWSIQNVDLAKQVEILYYNSEWKPSALVYPAGGWNEDVTIYTVDAGQTTTVNIPVDVSIVSISQPVMQTNVTREYSATSVYSIAGADGFPIVPAQWAADGGSLSVAIGEDGKSIDVTMVGATGATARYAPYRVAMSSGSSNYYSSLRIVGSGVHFTQSSYIGTTAVDNASTNREVGVTVDNIFISTENQAKALGMNVASKWAAPTRTISISKANINKPGETDQSFDYATFAQFDALYAGKTFAQFDTLNAGNTFADFDDYWYQLVADDFDFQVFGNANGARVQWRRAMYRIRSATISASSVEYTAESDTTFGDFTDHSAGMTFAAFDALYAGMTFNDYGLIPLPIVKPEYDR